MATIMKMRGSLLDYESQSDLRLLLMLAAEGRRPNFLIVCDHASKEMAGLHVRALCAAPIHTCQLPGSLMLPCEKRGTLMLDDVAALAIDQQVALYDWLGRQPGTIQVASVTTTPLSVRVEKGEFLEALYYRLNVVNLNLKAVAA